MSGRLLALLSEVIFPFYTAGLPLSQERPGANNFFGLTAETNRSLVTHRMYKLFEPWPLPIFLVAWDETKGERRVLAGVHPKVQLQPLGQAQAWTLSRFRVLWECYLHKSRRSDTRLEELRQFWRAVETDMGVNKIFTQPHEPTFEEGYAHFLSVLGYAPDQDFSNWGGKQT
jgi:hypothetical protein